MNNIIILGNGQLGSFLFKNLKINNYIVNIIDYPEFNITNQQMIKNIVNKYDIIINAAAYTLVDNAENEQLNCFMINSMGPIMLASECIKNNKKLIHISTESVYGSNNEQYIPSKETDNKYPVNVYSTSKNISDQYIENLNNDNILLLRPGWLFGPNNDHNFIEKIKRVLLAKEKIKVVTDQLGTLSYVGLILNAIELFLTNKLPAGTYNIGNTGYPSRYDIACFVKEQIKSTCIIEKCDSNEFKRTANVAKNSCLNCDKINQFMNITTAWEEDVLKVLKENINE